MNTNGWNEYKKLFEHLMKEVEKLSKKMDNMHADIAVLKVKAGIWGILGGAITLLIFLLIKVVI